MRSDVGQAQLRDCHHSIAGMKKNLMWHELDLSGGRTTKGDKSVGPIDSVSSQECNSWAQCFMGRVVLSEGSEALARNPTLVAMGLLWTSKTTHSHPHAHGHTHAHTHADAHPLG